MLFMERAVIVLFAFVVTPSAALRTKRKGAGYREMREAISQFLMSKATARERWCG